MKRILSILLVIAMLFSLTACAGDKAGQENQGSNQENNNGSNEGNNEAKTYKAALLLNGNLGDKSFYDSANEGLTKLRDELGKDKFDFKVEQMGATPADEAKWEPTVIDYCDSEEYDVIIVGTWQMAGILAKAAQDYPDQKFIFFDERFDFEANGNPQNIYNVLYKQNEVSFLVGAAAALMTTDESLSMVNPEDKKIGFLGGMPNAVIHDFLIGYIQGAQYIDPEVKVVKGFVGDFFDSGKGKDLALMQYNNGVDVGYNVAGGAGLGQIEAAVESNRYAFGVDSDQAKYLPDMAANIPTSALKNVGDSLIRAIKMDMEGKLTYGTSEELGFAENGVQLVKDAHYEEMLPESIRTKIDEIEADIVAGKIVVDTSFGKTDEEIKAIIEKAE